MSTNCVQFLIAPICQNIEVHPQLMDAVRAEIASQQPIGQCTAILCGRVKLEETMATSGDNVTHAPTLSLSLTPISSEVDISSESGSTVARPSLLFGEI